MATRPIKGKLKATSNFARGPRDANGRRGYLYDEEVLPPKLVKAVRAAFDGHCTLFTVKAGGQFNAAEEKCGDKLAWDIRMAMGTPSNGSLLLFVRGQRNKMNGTRDLLLHLMNEGYSMNVIAWALDKHPVTLRKYKLGRCEPVQHLPVSKRNLEIGYAVFRNIHKLPDRSSLAQLSFSMQKEPNELRALANEIGHCHYEAKSWQKSHKVEMFAELREPKKPKAAKVASEGVSNENSGELE